MQNQTIEPFTSALSMLTVFLKIRPTLKIRPSTILVLYSYNTYPENKT